MTPDDICQVRTIVSHKNCPDGIASALICMDAIPNALPIFVAYGTAEHADLPAEPGMLFVDMTPLRERADAFAVAGAWIIDHHEHAKDIVAKVGARGVYSGEPGVSGAVLAYREVWKPMLDAGLIPDSDLRDDVERLARLVGVRDTWQKGDAEWKDAYAESEVLKFYGEDACVEHGLDWVIERERDGLGHFLLAKAEREAREIARNALFTTTGRGVKLAILPTSNVSDASELVDPKEIGGDWGAPDVVAGFRYATEHVDGVDDAGIQHVKLHVSLRSRAGYDVGEVAKRFGGGGHKAAAGFTLTDPPALDPYGAIRGAFETFERQR